MNLLLHACCGPCSLEPVRLLQEAGHTITLAYMNSNIHPAEEYEHRHDTLRAWARENSLPVVEGVYNPDLWEEATAAFQGSSQPKSGEAPDAITPGKNPLSPPEDRCRACYRLRFEEAADYAAAHGFDGICTTLSVSPYQYTDTIKEELERAAEARGIQVIFEDFRPYYPAATQRSRDLGMYRQNYCGCRLSKIEAAEEREARKLARKAKRQAEREVKENNRSTNE